MVEHLERGKAGGALAYTGHNFRAADAARFFMAAAAARVALSPEEHILRAALLAQRVLVTVKVRQLSSPLTAATTDTTTASPPRQQWCWFGWCCEALAWIGPLTDCFCLLE